MRKSNWCERQGKEVSLDNGGVDAKFGLDEAIGLSTILGVYPSQNIDLIDLSSTFSPCCCATLL
jgi:hypothetical protein